MVNLNSNLGAATNAFILKQLFVTSFSLNLIVKKCTDGSPFLFPILSFEQSLQPVTAQTAERGSYELSFQEGDVNFPKLSFQQSLLFWLWEFGVESNNISQLILIIPFSSISLKMFWYILLYKEIAFWLLRGWKKSCILHLFHQELSLLSRDR